MKMTKMTMTTLTTFAIFFRLPQYAVIWSFGHWSKSFFSLVKIGAFTHPGEVLKDEIEISGHHAGVKMNFSSFSILIPKLFVYLQSRIV